MPGLADLGNVLNTVRELDINAIRDESERPVLIACVGDPRLVAQLDHVLTTAPAQGPRALGINPLVGYDLPLKVPPDELRRADMLLVVIDGRRPPSGAVSDSLQRLDLLALPTLLVILFADALPSTGARMVLSAASSRTIFLPDPQAPAAAELLAKPLLDRLPGELHLAVARRLPAVRSIYAQNLIGNVSFSNASYAFASGLPEQVPLLNIPFAAADLVVLTKNQALMVYRIALAHGAVADFQARMREVLPVIGGAFLWRQVARSLIGLIPVWGMVPKVTVAYAGTYSTGIAALRWFAAGERIPTEQLRQVSQEALAQGREWATKLLDQARAQSGKATSGVGSLVETVRKRMPGQR